MVKVNALQFKASLVLAELIKYKNGKEIIKQVAERVEHFILMQFTGLKDKNGIDICEGDIVKTILGITAVYWNEQCCCFDIDQDDNLEDGSGYYLSDDDDIEVIGNIYENPRLIK
jgi:uncharacterized phage protein (TIGR01671 family)